MSDGVEIDWVMPKPWRLLVARVIVAAVEARTAGGVEIGDGRTVSTVQASASDGAFPGAIIAERVDREGAVGEDADHAASLRGLSDTETDNPLRAQSAITSPQRHSGMLLERDQLCTVV